MPQGLSYTFLGRQGLSLILLAPPLGSSAACNLTAQDYLTTMPDID